MIKQKRELSKLKKAVKDLRKGRNGNRVSDQGTKTAIGKYATINGNKKAVGKFVVSVSQNLL